MLTVPVTFNVYGKLVKGDVSLSDNATPEQVEMFKEIQALSEFNRIQWNSLKNRMGRDDNWNKILTIRGILI